MRDRSDRHRHAVGEILHETEANAAALGDAHGREICRSADQRRVAAQARAERQAPPQRLDASGPP